MQGCHLQTISLAMLRDVSFYLYYVHQHWSYCPCGHIDNTSPIRCAAGLVSGHSACPDVLRVDVCNRVEM